MSSFIGPEQIDKMEHWDKSRKAFVEIERPSVVCVYNQFMGGVDLHASFRSKYKYRMKSKTVVRVMVLAHVIHAWLLHHRDCNTWQLQRMSFSGPGVIFTHSSSELRLRAFAHGAVGRRIDPSWGRPIELFLVPASAPRLV